MLKNFDNLAADSANGITVKSNFHTHNYLCGHAGGTVSDYVKVAVEHGLRAIGISDHCIAPVNSPSPDPIVTADKFLDAYLPQFDEARKLYGNDIKIYTGAEIEYFDGYCEFYEYLLTKLDYLVLGQHEYMNGKAHRNSYVDGTSEDEVLAYFDSVRRGLNSGFFSVLAHPDLIFYHHPPITEAVIKSFDETVRTAVELDIPLELNANGVRSHGFRYPTDLLVDLCKKYDAKVVVSSDAHSPDALCDEYMCKLRAYAEKVGLNVVDSVNMK